MQPKRFTLSLALLATLAGLALPALAEEKKLGLTDSAELSYVATTGNAETTTLSLKASLAYVWPAARFQLDIGALRAETTTVSRSAVGTGPDDYRLSEDDSTAISAENYFLRGRYEQDIAAGLYGFAGAGWERNEPTGIENRFSAVVGAGKVWFDGETARFKTDAGLTYTDQEDVVENPRADGKFVGVRLGYDYWRKLTATTTFTSVLIVDLNAEESEDLRGDFTNAVAVAMNERFSLKASLQLLYDHQPGLVAVPILLPNGTATGFSATTELDELDSIFSVALVASF